MAHGTHTLAHTSHNGGNPNEVDVASRTRTSARATDKKGRSTLAATTDAVTKATDCDRRRRRAKGADETKAAAAAAAERGGRDAPSVRPDDSSAGCRLNACHGGPVPRPRRRLTSRRRRRHLALDQSPRSVPPPADPSLETVPPPSEAAAN